MSGAKLTLPLVAGRMYVRRDGAIVEAVSRDVSAGEEIFSVRTADGVVIHSQCVVVGTGRVLNGDQGEQHAWDFVADHERARDVGHPHAASMLLYAQDAAETAEPWERWEYLDPIESRWHAVVDDHPSWDSAFQYRRKPKTIRIGTFDVPEPLRVAPPLHTMTWCASPLTEATALHGHWCGEDSDHRCLARGLVHLTREAAELHAKALLSLCTGAAA